MRAIRKSRIGWAAGTAVAAVALVGALHAPFARGLLMRIGGCPFAGAHMTAAQADVARHLALAVGRESASAPARPALGFVLDATTLADARRWKSDHHLACKEPREGLLQCADVPAQALGLSPAGGAVTDLELEFGPQGRLVNATTLRSRLTAQAASTAAGGIAASLGKSLGAPTRSTGSFDADHLARPIAESIATLSYHYADYVADVTAMRLATGVAVREQYMSARD